MRVARGQMHVFISPVKCNFTPVVHEQKGLTTPDVMSESELPDLMSGLMAT